MNLRIIKLIIFYYLHFLWTQYLKLYNITVKKLLLHKFCQIKLGFSIGY